MTLNCSLTPGTLVMIQLSTMMDSLKCPVVESNSLCYWKDMWQKLDRMRQQWQLCDVTLVTEDNKLFMGHSPVLAASSSAFYDLFIGQNRLGWIVNEDSRKVLLRGVTSDVLEVTLDFIYGITPLTRLAFERLQVGAKELGIKGAYEYCSRQLERLAVNSATACSRTNLLSDENLVPPPKWQLVLPFQPNGSGSDNDMVTDYVSTSSAYNPGLDAIARSTDQGPTAPGDWPPCEYSNAPRSKTGNSISTEPSPCQSVTLATESENFESEMLPDMPSDEIHSAMFTQMSLGDLTAGIRCPHIKGILEDNPMNTFLAEDESISEPLRASSSAEETDFDETPTLEDRGVDFLASVPLKKRKRRMSDASKKTEGTCCNQNNSAVQEVVADSAVSNNPIKCSTILKEPLNFAANGVDSSSQSSYNSLGSSTCETNVVYTDGSRSSALQQMNLMSSDKAATFKTPKLPCKSTGTGCQTSQVSFLESNSSSCELLPECSSFLYQRPSAENRLYQELYKNGGSDCGFVSPDLPPDQFSYNSGNCSYATEFVGSISDSSLTRLSPVHHAPSSLSQPSSSFIVQSTCVASTASFQPLCGQQNGRTERWGDAYDIWSLPPQKPTSHNFGTKLDWEPVSSAQGMSYNHEAITNREPALQFNMASDPKDFNNDLSQDFAVRRSSLSVSSSNNDGCTLPSDNRRAVSFSALGPSQGIVPNSLTRSQPLEICPSIADASIPISQSVDSGILRDAILPETTQPYSLQEGFVSSSPEPKEGGSEMRSRQCQFDLCDRSYKNARELAGHVENEHREDKPCPSCSMSFTSVSSLVQHLEVEHLEKLETDNSRLIILVRLNGGACFFDNCSYSNQHTDAVLLHLHQNHSYGQPTFSCELCSKGFFSLSQLNGHKKRSHQQQHKDSLPYATTPEKSTTGHQCQYCQESFKSNYKLQTHQLKVHSRGKLFSCQDCSFRSPRKKDVQAHMLSQHGRAPSGVKVYSCSRCEYKCIDRNRFEEHEAKHTGITSHRCPLCGRAYTTKRGMRTHLKYHSDERPHKCNICGAAFKVTSKLSDHMKLIHIQKGVKPYQCGYCNHATALRGNCNQHIRKNHPGQPLLVVDKFASQRKSVKDYDYAGMAGEGIEEHRDLEAARTSTRKTAVS